MEILNNYFLDTFAIIEFLRGNPKYIKLIQKADKIKTSWLNRMELYFLSLKETNEETAGKHFESFKPFEVEITEALLKKAMKKRLKLKTEGKNISYADAIGYQYAIENNMFFLTGDREFINLDNVKFLEKIK